MSHPESIANSTQLNGGTQYYIIDSSKFMTRTEYAGIIITYITREVCPIVLPKLLTAIAIIIAVVALCFAAYYLIF